MIRNSGYLALLAVALILVGTLMTAESFAEFEQRAMTRLFVLATLDTLVGSRLGARLVSAAHAVPSTAEAPESGLTDDRTADYSSCLRGIRRHRQARSRGTARGWIQTAIANRSGP